MSQIGTGSWAPTLDEATLRGRVAQWRADANRRANLLLLRADPSWSGAGTLVVGDESVFVVNGTSQLAVLDALHSHPDQPLVVLTDLDDQELGSAVRLRAERHTVQSVDAWELVPGLFKVSGPVVDQSVRSLGSWLPQLLLTHRRSAGWPVATSGTLTGDHVIRSILADIMGVDGVDEVDLVALLDHLDEPQTGARLKDYSAEELEGIAEGTARHLGGASALALRSRLRARNYSSLAVALVTDLMWNRDAPTAVRVRLEERFFGVSLPAHDAQSLGEAARAVILRREAAADAHLDEVLRQAEAILDDVQWPEGARTSTILPAGLEQRFADFALALEAAEAASNPASAAAVENSLAAIHEHVLATHVPDEVLGVEMATRVARWLATPTSEDPASIDSAARRYWHGSAWADRARSVIWNGSSRPALALAYGELANRITARRSAEDTAAGAVLNGDTPSAIIPVETLLAHVVEPIAAARVLLIVLDGMSAAVAAELAEEAQRLRWVEVLPDGYTSRLTALATLPSITRYSRSSLFAGRLTDGNQSTEKSAFAKSGGVLFHKDELRSPAGALLPDAVEAAIAHQGQKVVGVVLNTIDDALAKADPDATRWTLAQVANLPALLDRAAAAGRIVVLTSDHGHVIERGGEYRANSSGGARWRLPDTPPVSDETLVSGDRVLAPGGAAILARAEGLRYTAKAAGYHGGASLAEITVPIVVLRPAGIHAPKGWQDAPPQAPEWWYESAPATAPAVEVRPSPAKNRPAKRAQTHESATAMFELPIGDDAPSTLTAPLSAALIACQLYAVQRDRTGRHALNDAVVAGFVDAADQRGGRINRDVLAGLLHIPLTAVDTTLAALRRLLNIDGFDVVSSDADGQTVLLDRQLLREQFGLK